MSADNWTQCPQCEIRNLAYLKELDEKAAAAYGKVRPEEFDELRDHARSFRANMHKDDAFCATLREDYEIGIYQGEFSLHYTGHCSTCGFNYSYKYEDKDLL